MKRAAAVAMLAVLAGCSTLPTKPGTSSAVPERDERFVIEMTDARIVAGFARFRAVFRDRLPEYGVWEVEAYLDTDQNNATGWSGRGYDFVLRNGRVRNADLSLLIRRAVNGTFTDSVGLALLEVRERDFSLFVPLSLLDRDDGRMDWQVSISRGQDLQFWRGSLSP